MKEKSTTHKAEELGSAEGATPRGNSETLKSFRTGTEILKCEQPVPQLTGEEKFLESVMEFTRGLKCSAERDIANAAREWEAKFDFRIRIEMQRRKRRAVCARVALGESPRFH
jgi:hypothetical protein